MNTLSNIKIGKKMALVLGVGALQLVCVGGLALWGIHSIGTAVAQSRQQSQKQVASQQIMNDVARLFVGVGNIVLSGKQANQEQGAVLALRKEYRAIIADLKTNAETDQETQLMDRLDRSTGPWRDADNQVMKLALAGKRDRASIEYRESALPRFNDVARAVGDVLQWRQKRVEEMTVSRTLLMSRMSLAILVVGLSVLILTAIFTTLITRGIVNPLKATVTHLGEVARGDISRDVEARHRERGDEIGVLANSLQTMTVSLRGLLQDVGGGIRVLSSSSAELSLNSTQMSDGAHHASGKAQAVAAAAGQMAANVTSVASGMEQTTNSLTSVASATDQMTATIGEIASNSERARRITGEAARQADDIREQMNQLGAAAQQIGKVTETITEISSQTNLLALNATIEAARAGSAGRGFAVVANEIKQLAQQTAAATEDITGRIAGVQSSTAGGIAAIAKVVQVIHEVSDLVSSIATAIEEQSAVTKQIADSIGKASGGVLDANKRVSEASRATAEMAEEVVGVGLAAGRMATGSEQVKASAGGLSKVAEQLQTTIQRFNVGRGHDTLQAPLHVAGVRDNALQLTLRTG